MLGSQYGPLDARSCFGHPSFLLGHPTTKVKGLKFASPVHYKKKWLVCMSHIPSYTLLLPRSFSSSFSASSLLLLLCWFIFFVPYSSLLPFVQQAFSFEVSYSSFHVLLDSLFWLLVVSINVLLPFPIGCLNRGLNWIIGKEQKWLFLEKKAIRIVDSYEFFFSFFIILNIFFGIIF